MAVKIGNLDISAFKVGSSDCKVYLGDTLLYPTTPPSFQGKWLATYNGGTTSSAECDTTSAITSGEITKTNLVSIEIGDCVTSIGNQAFQNCSGLTSCTIGSGVTSIGKSAFIGCSSLTSITCLATTPPTLASGAFDNTNNCPIYVPSDSVNAYKAASRWSTYASRIQAIPTPFQGKWKATYSDSSTTSAECDASSAITQNEITLTDLVSVEIGDCVTSIGEVAFIQCTSLTSIVIPDSVTSIGMQAFTFCSSLTSVTVNATTPPSLGFVAFYDTNDCPIYVPAESVNAYKSASGWSDYSSRIQPIP